MLLISDLSVELLNMFGCGGEGPRTRSSIRIAQDNAFSTPMKYITRAALHRANESQKAKTDVLEGFPKMAIPKEDKSKKFGRS